MFNVALKVPLTFFMVGRLFQRYYTSGTQEGTPIAQLVSVCHQ